MVLRSCCSGTDGLALSHESRTPEPVRQRNVVLKYHHSCAAQFGSFGGCAFRYESNCRRTNGCFCNRLALDIPDFRFHATKSRVDRIRLKGVDEGMGLIFQPDHLKLRMALWRAGVNSVTDKAIGRNDADA